MGNEKILFPSNLCLFLGGALVLYWVFCFSFSVFSIGFICSLVDALMSNPLPIVAHFSGGRSSAVMVLQMIKFEQTRPDYIVFCNTGMETLETLQFVDVFDRKILQPLGFSVIWLEFDVFEDKKSFRVVDFDTASRRGEPFISMIRKVKTLPDTRRRFCTSVLKVDTASLYLRRIQNLKDWISAIGFRADEPLRLSRMRLANDLLEQKKNGVWTDGKKVRIDCNHKHRIAPLADLNFNKEDVLEHLAIYQDVFSRTLAFVPFVDVVRLSNCKGCFFGSYPVHLDVAANDAETAAIWSSMEDLRASFIDVPVDVAPVQRVQFYSKKHNAVLSDSERQKYTFNSLYSWADLISYVNGGDFSLGAGADVNFGGCGDGFCGTD